MRLVDCDKLSTLLEGTIPVRTTIRYPTRYAAFDNPGSIVLYQPGPNDPMRGEVAVFHLPMPNEHWSGIVDGLYAEVYALPRRGSDRYYRVEAQGTRPDEFRLQHVRSRVVSEVVAQAVGWAAILTDAIREVAEVLLAPAWEALRKAAEQEERALTAVATATTSALRTPAQENEFATRWREIRRKRALADDLERRARR